MIFHCGLYWHAALVPSSRVILYMAFLLNISKRGRERRSYESDAYFFSRVKTGDVSSGLVIITDQLLIKIK